MKEMHMPQILSMTKKYHMTTGSRRIDSRKVLIQPSIYWYGVENEWNLIRQEEYDVVFVLDMYPELKYAKNNIRNKNLADIVEIWRNFQSNIENKLYYNNLRKSKPYVYTRLIIEQKTVLNSPDIDGVLGIGNEYDMPVVVGADTKPDVWHIHRQAENTEAKRRHCNGSDKEQE